MKRALVLIGIIVVVAAWFIAFRPPRPQHDTTTQLSHPRPRGQIDMATTQLLMGGMTKKEVRKLVGLPAKSTDTEWFYASEANDVVEVKFSTKGRVIQVTTFRQARPIFSK
jgi:hypothetical protein